MKRVLFVILCVIFSHSVFAASPDDLSNRLMGDKVSLLDFGCFKTELMLKEIVNMLEDGNFLMDGHCYYDMENDKIILSILIIPKDIVKKEKVGEGFIEVSYPQSKSWGLFKKKIKIVYNYLNDSFNRFSFVQNFFHEGYNIEGGIEEGDFKKITAKFKIIFVLDAFNKLAEDQNGKLNFFDIDHKKIIK